MRKQKKEVKEIGEVTEVEAKIFTSQYIKGKGFNFCNFSNFFSNTKNNNT